MFILFAEPTLGGAEGAAAPAQQGTTSPGSNLQNSYKIRKKLKMSQLPAPERGPVNVMSLQAPKDLKRPL
jgi:hypothetical protein